MPAPDRHGGGFGGAGGLSLRSDELSRLGKGPSGGDGAVPGTLISVGGEEGERCRAGSSLWGWHGGDCAWARRRGVWRPGGAWVWQWAGTKQFISRLHIFGMWPKDKDAAERLINCRVPYGYVFCHYYFGSHRVTECSRVSSRRHWNFMIHL